MRPFLSPRASLAALAALSLAARAWHASGPHSGQGVPPRYGDYEAQRHWLQVCFRAPLRLWYSWDLEHWGLDYPPLSASPALTARARCRARRPGRHFSPHPLPRSRVPLGGHGRGGGAHRAGAGAGAG